VEFHATIVPPLAPDELVDIAAEAQQLGYDRFWIPDQTFHADPFLLLQRVAEVVDIPLGLAVTSPFARHPVQIARSISTLLHLSSRRDWIMALGLANANTVLAPLGIRVQRPAPQLAAALRAIRSLLAGERVSVVQDGFVLEDCALSIEPLWHVPLFVGTRGPRVLEEAVGPEADGVLIEGLFTPAAISWARTLLDRGSRNAGRGAFDRPLFAWQVSEVLMGGEQLSTSSLNFGKMLMRTTSAETLRHMDVPKEAIENVRQQGEHADVPASEVAKFVAAGSPDQLAERVTQARDTGVSAWSSVFVGQPEGAVDMMRRFAREVLPLVNRKNSNMEGAS
jgi:alkanesulfonate monooxygenase SsuD/methylene tetrahydromethanopterin reductase-like flavin-dependent oxidoreductase (luciferase family)